MTKDTTTTVEETQYDAEEEDSDGCVDADLQEDLVHHKYNEQQGVAHVTGIHETRRGKLAVDLDLPFGDDTTTVMCGQWDDQQFQSLFLHAGIETPEFDSLVGHEVPVIHDEDEGWQLDDGALPAPTTKTREFERDDWTDDRDKSHLGMQATALFFGGVAGVAFAAGYGLVAIGIGVLVAVAFAVFLRNEYAEISDLREGRFDWVR